MSYDEHLISMAGGDGDVLDQIQRRADAATDGPWDMAVSSDRKWALVLANSGTEDECRVARAVDDDDAEFIAHARTDIPALLAMVREQARQAREQARKLNAVTSIAVKLEGSMQGEDREIAEDLYTALGLS